MSKKDSAYDSTILITIDDLHVLSKHGYYAEERRVEQEFLVSLSLHIDAGKAASSDDLKHTLDYDDIREIVAKTFGKRKRYLLEALAHDVCNQLMKDVRVQSVEISIKKMAVWKDGIPGVRVIKKRLNT